MIDFYIISHLIAPDGQAYWPAYRLEQQDLLPELQFLFLINTHQADMQLQRGKKDLNKDPLLTSYLNLYSICRQITNASFCLSLGNIRNLVFGGCLCWLSVIDFKTHRIPNNCLLIALSAWILHALLEYTLFPMIALRALSAAFLGGTICLVSFLSEKILKKHCLGYGDIKLYTVAGLYLGFVASIFSILLSCIFGLLYIMVAVILRKKKNGYFPFGPCIALASWIMLLYGQPLVRWYFR